MRTYIFLLLIFISTNVLANPKWDSKLVVGNLDNGLKYVIYPSKNKAEPFNLRLIVHAGSIDDSIPGIAHILEHMSFRTNTVYGTTVHQYLDKIGWKTGKQVNALTRAAETQFMIRTRPDDAINLHQSIQMLANLSLHSAILSRDWHIERKVILEELRMDESVAKRINDQKKAIIRHNSHYANGPTIGFRNTIKKITAADIRAFHDKYYVPDNMTLIISGYVDPNKATEWIKQSFSGHYHVAPQRDYLELPLFKELYMGKVQDPQGSSSYVTFGNRLTLASKSTDLGIEQRLQNYVLRKLIRLHMNRVKQAYKDDPAIKSIFMTIKEATPERIIVALRIRSKHHAKALNIALKEWQRLSQVGFNKEDLATVRAQALQTLVNNEALIKQRRYTDWEDKITSTIMQEGVLESYSDSEPHLRRLLHAMTVDSLNQRLHTLLSSQDQFLIYQAPQSVTLTLPTKEEVKKTLNDYAQAKYSPLPSATESIKATTSPQAPKLPSIKWPNLKASTHIASKQVWSSANVTRWSLKNGDEVVWLNRKNSDNALYIKVLSNSGYANTHKPSWRAQTAAQIWQQSDATFASQKAIKQWAELEKTTWQWKQQENALDLSLRVMPAHLDQAFRLYAAMHHTIALTDAEWLQTQHDLLQQTSLAEQDKDSIQQTTAAELRNDIADMQAQPNTIYIVGDLNEQQIQENILPYLSALKRDTKTAITPLRDTIKPVNSKQIEHVFHTNKAVVEIKGQTPMPWTPEKSFSLSSLNPIIQQALKNELRHKLGGIYKVDFELTLSRDNLVHTNMRFSCDPNRVEELIAASRRVYHNLASSITQYNLPQLRSDIDYAERMRLSSPNTWLNRLALSFERYQSPQYLQSMSTLKQHITAARLVQWVQEIFPQPTHQITISLPLDKA
ncbi:M16 family metallopeptidase [Vibrio nitrifigilis]|uniref:Insulinase family protein n=1 Tax=Vibrio nitrifigilis TaxID=2789781 RepID=A0ABS0GEU9_9VIBR|nr:M16 family metallopeptidase [Vibrio nitrifigilis]MBF9000928.1 insulinase family protein [Vibrio nitrifigilis]